MPALFSIANPDVDIRCMLGARVDDILWDAGDETQSIIDGVLNEFDIREIKTDSFRYCGLEIEQYDDFTVTVKARDNIENIVPVSYPKETALTRPCSEGETSQLRSIVGAIAWVA